MKPTRILLIVIFVLLLIVAGCALVLPRHLVAGFGQLVILTLLAMLLLLIIVATLASPIPSALEISLKGKTYHYPSIPDVFLLILSRDPPALWLSPANDICYHPVPMLCIKCAPSRDTISISLRVGSTEHYKKDSVSPGEKVLIPAAKMGGLGDPRCDGEIQLCWVRGG